MTSSVDFRNEEMILSMAARPLTNVHLSFAAGGLPTSSSDNPMVQGLLGTQVEKVNIQVHGQNDAETALSVSWQPLLQAIATSTSSLTHLSIESIFDCVGTHALKLSELTETIRSHPHLQQLRLDSIGFWVDDENDAMDAFDTLQQAVRQHEHLRQIHFTKVYFCQQRRADSWLLYSRLARALAVDSLTHLALSSATRYYTRPILTLPTLQILWSLPQLTSLQLGHFNLWGAGSAQYCRNSLRRNTTLQNLSFQSCVFAAANDPSSQSLLVGLDENKSVKCLDLTNCMLHLEASGMVQALAVNQTLERIGLDQSRLGFDLSSHGGNFCRFLCALQNHPRLNELSLLGAEPMASEPTRAIYNAILELVRHNKNITLVKLDASQDEHLQSISQHIGLQTGLNRAGYWLLSQAHSPRHEWTQAMSKVQHKDSAAVATLYHILRDNPLLCQAS